MWPIIIVTSLWVFFDAKRIGIKKGQITGIANLGPGGWLIACLLLWVVAFPIYVVKRPQFIRVNQKDYRSCWNKLDTSVAIFVSILIIWLIVITVQDFQRTPIARKIIDDKIEKLKNEGFENLIQRVGKGYAKETITNEGINYYLGYVVTKPGSINGAHTESSSEIISSLKPGEKINEVEIYGYVDCVTIIPIGYFKMGPSFEAIINKSGEVKRLKQ